MKSATISVFALSTMLFSASTSFAQELATKDRIGLADAPKSLVVRLTNDSPNNSDPAIAELLHAGISTSAEVTELAGRGVGLDLVRDVARKLHGRASLQNSTVYGALA